MSAKLTTTLAIYEAVRAEFPAAVFRVTKLRPTELSIQLTANYVFQVSHSVNQLLLNFHLMAIKMGQKSALSLGQKDLYSDQADEPLSNLAEFTAKQREIYESNGKKCFDLFLQYLSNPNPNPTVVDELRTLGLDPEQLTTELGLVYFRKIEMEFPQLLPTLKARYPQVFAAIQLQLCRDDINAQRTTNYDRIVAQLGARVLGQDLAVQMAAAALDKAQNDQEHNAFLFVGPTGVGKTELARTIASLKKHFIMFRMNQYPDETHVSTLFGASTGYFGSDDKPHLAKELDRCPDKQVSADNSNVTINHTVILFDEMEKAHPKMRQSLLSLADDGEVQITYTKRNREPPSENAQILYKLNNCVVIATSNLFADVILAGFQNNHNSERISETFAQANALTVNPQEKFSHEFLGRFQTIPFGPLHRNLFKQILKSTFESFVEKLKKDYTLKEITIENENGFYESLNNKHYGNGTDVRKTKKYIKRLNTHVKSNQSKWGDLKNKKLVFYSNQQGQILMKLYQFALGEYIDISTLIPPVVI